MFKFIAVLLCAASLLGAVGSGLFIYGMTALDLYDKSVDQVYAEQVEHKGRSMANTMALTYASSVLGGCPEAMVQNTYGFGNYFVPGSYGYILKDAEGNVLLQLDLPEGSQYTTHTFPVTGQYMHLVDTVTESEQIAQEAAEQETTAASAESVLFDAIPAEGAAVSDIQLALVNSSYGSAGDEVGFVFRNQEGLVILRCPGWHIDENEDGAIVTALTLRDSNGELLYDAAWHSGVGFLQAEADGSLRFISFPVEAAAEEIVALAEEETVPATESETVPEETVAATEETVAEETAEAAAEETAAEASAEEATEAPAETEAQEVRGGAEDEVVPVEETAAAEKAEAETEAAVEETTPETVPEETVVEETVPEETVPAETVPEVTEPPMINGKRLDSYQINRTNYYDPSIGENVAARYVYITMPEMTLELYVTPGALYNEGSFTLLRLIQSVRSYLFPVLGISLLLFAATLVYLFCAAAKQPGTTEIRAGGLNRIPLDLYLGLAFGGTVGLTAAIGFGGEYVLQKNETVAVAYMGGLGFIACLLVVGFLFATAAQLKTPGGFWWRNSLVGWTLRLCRWILRKALECCAALKLWMDAKGFPMLKQLLDRILNLFRTLWKWFSGMLKRIGRWLYLGLSHFYDLLPMTWQWILTGGVMVLFLFITLAGGFEFGIILALLFAFGLILYGANCFGSLMEATRKMNKGNLDAKADDKRMVGAFKDFAHDLNDLADVAVVAAQKQLKSERMKTELITNVSHDIKTPLTSIINYVDLLQKPHSEEEQDQYLEVLDRQSQRLKKLVDDLIEMSKASTGNMAVDVTLVDAVESVNQALGEFSDKLERAQLIPVFRHSDDTVAMMADGKLVWRVLSNLLSNAVKYAMPGTRLYVDLMSLDSQVVISLKNISREPLNITADELMERFVRGDDSRNTEGSGLGLNIAKSLMELQKGQLHVLVDGDLFKVTLIFPGL